MDEFSTNNTYAIMMEMGVECPWRNTEGFHCDQEASVNTTLPGNVRWHNRACDCAWWDFTNEWRQVSREEVTISFSDSAAGFFEAGEGKWECDNVKIGCDQMGMQCMDSQVSNTTGPAGALIMASFAHTSHVSSPPSPVSDKDDVAWQRMQLCTYPTHIIGASRG